MPTWPMPIGAQTTPRTCWEACGRMMFAWRWMAEPKKLAEYKTRCGAFAGLDVGLDEKDMTKFYRGLGLRVLTGAKGYNVRYALAWTPVIVTAVGGAKGHAIILSGHEVDRYAVINPAGMQTVDFGNAANDGQQVTVTAQAQRAIDSSLGPTIWYW